MLSLVSAIANRVHAKIAGLLFASFHSSAAKLESVTLVPPADTHDMFQSCQTSPQVERLAKCIGKSWLA